MLDSVRARLTVWYTAVLVAVLVALGVVTGLVFLRSVQQRMDADLNELSDAFLVTVRAEMQDIEDAPDPLKAAVEVAIAEHHFRDHVYGVVDASGRVIISSLEGVFADSTQRPGTVNVLDSASFREFLSSAAREDPRFGKVKGRRGGYRAFARRFSIRGNSYTLVILRSLHPQEEMLEEVTATFAWVIPVAILLASGGGYFLARKSLAPVVAMSSQAGRIGAANLHERLAIQNERDELGHLARSFNSLLDRLSESFERQRRFMADASHELRTPVAILRGEAEVALSQQRSLEDYRESLGVLHHEAERLTHIVEDLFTLTRADAGQYPLQLADFYLEELIGECVHSARTLALGKKISLTFDDAAESPVHADESLLRRMILNLLDNAIKYSSEGGRVTIACRREGDFYALRITDTGAGIPPELQPKIFERFFRVDKARSRSENDGGGAGLGLAISRWIAEAHQGRLELTRSDATGSTFTAYLPANSANPAS